MFEYIKGIIAEIYPSYLILENNGIGYLVYLANPFRLAGSINTEEKIYIYQQVTQDDVRLYGFATINEKRLFTKLINVSGIGPKSALAILANEDHAGLVRAIENEDVKFLQKFPGVGKKTASQITLDLKGKLQDLTPEDFASFHQNESDFEANEALSEAIEALKALGYTKREVEKVGKNLDGLEEMKTDEYIREGLKLLLHG